MNLGQPLGSVIQGSLTGGLEVRLHPDISVEDMRVGKFLVVQGMRSRFFCMLTDVALGAANQRIMANPPEWEDTFLREILAGSGIYRNGKTRFYGKSWREAVFTVQSL